MNTRVRALASALILAATALLALVVPAPAASASVTFNAQTWNVCGRACDMTTNKIGTIGYYIASVIRPQVVILNEVCNGQFEALKANLVSRGYAMDGYFGQASVDWWADAACTYGLPSGQSGRYGNAVLTRGAFSSYNNTLLTRTGDQEQRGYLCMTTMIARSTRVCGTHLATGTGSEYDRYWGINQIANYHANLGASAPIISGGDFNTTPGQTDIAQMYFSPGYSTEVDRADNEITRDTRKIDYVFHRHSTLRGSTGAVVTPTGPYPGAFDHRILYGNIIED